ncbi:translation initiation factor IF-2 [Geotalea sp. SG265]|uniref:translation initiation factor IF-2 n=1 Tax=Geotalea sp. SG265 TaxID=2922867 RepID=UPI001FAF612D|nr:translation initiation factor IF-2 [Geotalea sp. SG265]
MSKTRVYELAQQMGIDNKELMAKLAAVGVEVKNHMAAIDDADIKKLSAPATVKEVSQEEVRVKPTLIRRRAKVVETVVEEPPVEAKAEPAPVQIAEKAPEVEKPKAEEVPPAVPTPPAAEPVKAQPAEEAAPEKPSPNKAKILGRVEIPGLTQKEKPPVQREGQPAARILERPEARRSGERPAPTPRPEGQRPGQRPEAGYRPGGPRPAGRPEGRPGYTERPVTRGPERPGQARGPERPAAVPLEMPPVGEDRRKGRKGKEAAGVAGKKGAAGAPAPKRKEEFKKSDLFEKHERVFEPGPRGKGKRKAEKVQIGKKTEITVPKAIKRIIKISETITVGELAKRMGIKANDLIRALMKMGVMATINHALDVDTATILATDFGYEIENVALDIDEILESAPDAPESLVKRPPVVTIMGHVDHGKTSLLDAIRQTNVIAGEAGGITQHIGAYDVTLNGRKITFLDTPGHEAFTAMRARGAKVTDIVILVVAADDGVMPQTREAVNHSKAAGVPIIVAVNKIDKPEAKPERVKQELMELGLVSEEWGGDTIFVDVSAKKRINLPTLLEMVLLQADVLELKANPDKEARGTIVEAKLDKGRGPVATVLVQEGTLKVGDYFVAGVNFGRVRAMQNDRAEKVATAGPSMPVEVIGFTGVPDAGDVFVALADEKQAKEIASLRQQKVRETELAKHSKLSLEQLYEKIQMGEVKDLNTIVKGDVQGSVEAVSESLRKLSTDAIRLNVIHASVGAITETDVNLATASNAIILGFNVRPEVKAQALAEKEGVDIRLYNIIYDAVDDIKKAMEGLLEPTLREKFLGRAEIRETFSVPKHGTVAGSYVLDGKMIRNSQVRLLRDNVVVFEGKMASLRRFKDDVKEVASGYECGISIENYNDLKVGDIIESFEMEKVAAKL